MLFCKTIRKIFIFRFKNLLEFNVLDFSLVLFTSNCTPQKWHGQPHLNFRAGSTFPVPVCTVPSSMDRTSRCNKVDAVRFCASYRLNLLLPKGLICVMDKEIDKSTPVYRVH